MREYAVIENKTIAIIHIKDKANAPIIIVNKEKNNQKTNITLNFTAYH